MSTNPVSDDRLSADSTPTEREVAALWCEVLHSPSVTPTDNFFALGGDSLAVMMVLFKVHEVLGVELPPGSLLESPCLRDFCMLVDSSRAGMH